MSEGRWRPGEVARVVAAGALAVLLAVGVAWTSRVPVALEEGRHAHVRLSWRVDGVSIEECRVRTPEELERLPIHMRNPEACIGKLAPFELRARVGAHSLVDTIYPGGARGDRPVSVFRELRLEPGRVPVEVRFEALLPDTVPVDPGGRGRFRWSGEVELSPGDVALLTLGEGERPVILTPRRGS